MLSIFWPALAPEISSYRPWLWLLASLAVSAAWLLSSRQDVGLGATAGAVLGQAVALFVLLGMLVKSLLLGWWIQALISAAALSGQIWLVKRLHFSRRPL